MGPSGRKMWIILTPSQLKQKSHGIIQVKRWTIQFLYILVKRALNRPVQANWIPPYASSISAFPEQPLHKTWAQNVVLSKTDSKKGISSHPPSYIEMTEVFQPERPDWTNFVPKICFSQVPSRQQAAPTNRTDAREERIFFSTLNGREKDLTFGTWFLFEPGPSMVGTL